MFTERDTFWMQRAISLAQQGAEAGEVPVGAVLVLNDEVIGEGYNRPIMQHDPTAHAEIVAIRAGAEKVGNYRLLDTTLYVTLEPCMMCAGAMVHARVQRLIYGASDPKAGAICSKAFLLDELFLNHRVTYSGGLLGDFCANTLREFFKERR